MMDKKRKKEFGAFYTPREVADFIASRMIQRPSDTVVEPSFGGGEFIKAAWNRLKDLGQESPKVFGTEIMEEPFHEFRKKHLEMSALLSCGDFLEYDLEDKIDVIIGNPPYVQLKKLPKEKRRKAEEVMHDGGISCVSRSGLWSAFILHSMTLLATGGRIGFVLPFSISYAEHLVPLWKLLGEKFQNLSLIRIRKDMFPDAGVEGSILFAEGYGGRTDDVCYLVHDTITNMAGGRPLRHARIPISDIGKKRPFMTAMLPEDTKDVLKRLECQGILSPASMYCRFFQGYVCGNKEYFHPDRDTILRFSLPDSSLIPCIRNASGIPSGRFNTKDMKPQALLFLPNEKSGKEEISYIRHGEDQGVNKGYKCRNRNPWYKVPLPPVPAMILDVFGNVPKLTINDGGFQISSSLIGVEPRGSREGLICQWYSSLTPLMLELFAAPLGGGCLNLHQGKMKNILLPPPPSSEDTFAKFAACIKGKSGKDAYMMGDSLILYGEHGLSWDDILSLRNGAEYLRSWRRMRDRR